MELMTVAPRPNSNGEIIATKSGGRRRIDRILIRNDISNKKISVQKKIMENDIKNNSNYFQNLIISAWFSSALAGLSDHIPFILQIENKKDKN